MVVGALARVVAVVPAADLQGIVLLVLQMLLWRQLRLYLLSCFFVILLHPHFSNIKT